MISWHTILYQQSSKTLNDCKMMFMHHTTKKGGVFDVSNRPSKKPRQNFLTWQKFKRQTHRSLRPGQTSNPIVVYDRAKRAGSEKKKKETSFMPQVKPINTPRRKKRKKNEGNSSPPLWNEPRSRFIRKTR
jgi:hypothetical protein